MEDWKKVIYRVLGVIYLIFAFLTFISAINLAKWFQGGQMSFMIYIALAIGFVFLLPSSILALNSAIKEKFTNQIAEFLVGVFAWVFNSFTIVTQLILSEPYYGPMPPPESYAMATISLVVLLLCGILLYIHLIMIESPIERNYSYGIILIVIAPVLAFFLTLAFPGQVEGGGISFLSLLIAIIIGIIVAVGGVLLLIKSRNLPNAQ
ncbi:MAG: hypothetical protein LUQ65_14620 [Candidatus Helarchaeota archaeon]|nr:hypothetical protein [Candidatus Helarchaeota archaeon]